MFRSITVTPKILSSMLISRSIRFNQAKTLTYETRIRRSFDDGIDLKRQTVVVDPIQRVRRCAIHEKDNIWTLYKTVHSNVKTLGDALDEGCVNSKDGPCIGLVKSSNGNDTLEWVSYSKVKEQSRYVGSYLLSKTKLMPMHSKVAILSSNRLEYLVAEQACYMYGFAVISLYTTYDSATILNILRRTQTEVLVIDNLKRIQTFQDDLLNNDHIKQILVMDDIGENQNSKICSLSKILKSLTINDLCERPTVDPDSTATLILTSGTTGEPKLAMVSHENLLATAKGHIVRLEKSHIRRPLTDRHCSFLPMAHVYERFILLQILLCGTQVVFCPEPEKLPQYLSIVKPTQASVVPRVLNRVYDRIMTEVNKSKIKKFLVQQALRQQPSFLSHFLFRKVRKLFGNELRVMIVGAAPIVPDVMHFFRIALDIPIMMGYGQTESAGGGTSTHPIDMSYGLIGTPTPMVEAKLVDVPGTSYLSENNQGQLCIRGPNIFKGYYDDEAKTKEVIDQDGWLYTGDVAEWTSTGALRVIDRTKHIFKLSQGHYVAPERLEDVYVRSQWIAQIFVDGFPTESSVVAIVIPDEEYVRKNYPLKTTGKTMADLCNDVKLKEIIFSDMKQLAEMHKLKTYETLSNIYLHPELFSQENELLTVTLKTRRSNARKHFEPILKSLYQINLLEKNNTV